MLDFTSRPVLALLLASAFVAAPAWAADPAPALGGLCLVAAATPECVATFDGAAARRDFAEAVAASPDGARVFVAGRATASNGLTDLVTVAHDAATLERLWVATLDAGSEERAAGVVTSPDGARVFVSASSVGPAGTGFDLVVVAYDAVTGAEVWATRYDAGSRLAKNDYATGVAVSADGATVVAAGSSQAGGYDAVVLALDAATGATRWTSRLDAAGRDDFAAAVAVSGDRAFVAASSLVGPDRAWDYATFALDLATGATAWSATYNGRTGGNSEDLASAIAVGAGRVVVTGSSIGAGTDRDVATVAYDAASGAALWSARSAGSAGIDDRGAAVVLSADGARAFVAGFAHETPLCAQIACVNAFSDYVTLAYDAATGAEAWRAAYDGPAHESDFARAVAVSGGSVLVTGVSRGATTCPAAPVWGNGVPCRPDTRHGTENDAATLAYDAATGDLRWVARYVGGGDLTQEAGSALAVAGGRVLVAGETSSSANGNGDVALVAYPVEALLPGVA